MAKHIGIGKNELYSIDTIGGVVKIETRKNISIIKITSDDNRSITRIKLFRIHTCPKCNSKLNFETLGEEPYPNLIIGEICSNKNCGYIKYA